MLRHPALVARHHRGDAEREALLAQQRVAAVARPVRPDAALVGEVDDVLLGVAGPRHVALPARQRLAHRVHARHELAVAQRIERAAAHARHDPHVHHDVRRVGQLHAELRQRRAERSHAERDDVHRPAPHAAREQLTQRLPHLLRVDPVVRRPGVLLPLAADEGAVLDPGHVTRVGQGEEAVGTEGGIEALEGAGGDHLFAEPLGFGGRSVTPVDRLGSAEFRHLGDPRDEPLILHPARRAGGGGGGWGRGHRHGGLPVSD